MAYNSRSNPDALPAHITPDEAAERLGERPEPSPTYSLSSHSSHGRPPTAPPPQGRHYSHSQSRPPPQSPYQHPHSPPPQSPHHQYHSMSPAPSQGYNHGPPPRSHSARPPPGPPQDPLRPLFDAVDKDRSGFLSEKELGLALVNGDWTRFDPHTVRMMIRMFDTDRSGTIGFPEFCGLWAFLAEWRKLFDRFDRDRSGTIEFDEFEEALRAFGYSLSRQFVHLLFKSYDRKGQHSAPDPQGINAISFDLFVQACISLKRLTEVFKKYDKDRTGWITISFEDFLTEILKQR